MSTTERAFELARSGTCHTLDEIRRRPASEGYDMVSACHSGGTIKAQLNKLLVDKKAARDVPEPLFTRFGAGAGWLTTKPMDNRFNPVELTPRSRAYLVREQDGARGLDVMSWDVLGGAAAWPMTVLSN